MTEPVTSTDPRFHQFAAAKHSDLLNYNITCYGYGVANDATIAEYAARPRDKSWRPPHIGDASGVNVNTYSITNLVTADTVCEFAERDGLKRLPTPDITRPLPKASPGHRLVALLYGRRNDRFEYHTLREHEGTWSHKFGKLIKPSMQDMKGQLITDPRKASFYDMQQGPFFFEVPLGGVDLRVKPELGELLDRIHEAHQEMQEQAKKRRVNMRRPVLARDFELLATMAKPVMPEFSRQLAGLVELHNTGKPPEGMKLRSGAFKHA